MEVDGRSQVGKDLQRSPSPTSARSRDQARELRAISTWVSETPKDGRAGPTCSTA